MSLIPQFLKDSETLPLIRVPQAPFAERIPKRISTIEPDGLNRVSGLLMRNKDAGYVRTWVNPMENIHLGSNVTITKTEYKAAVDMREYWLREEQKLKDALICNVTDRYVTLQLSVFLQSDSDEGESFYLVEYDFTRRYVLPKNCNMYKVKAVVSEDEILTITAPRENVVTKPINITRLNKNVKWLIPTLTVFNV